MEILRIETSRAFRSFWHRCRTKNDANPFCSEAWLATWAEHFADKASNEAIAVVDGDEVLAVVPFLRTTSLRDGDALQLFGSGEVCTDYLSLPVDSSRGSEAMSLVAQHLHQRRHTWEMVKLTGVVAGDPGCRYLAMAMQSLGYRVQLEAGMPCWRLELPTTWEEMLAKLSKSHRKLVRRLQKRVLNQPGVSVKWANNAREVAYGMDVLVQLHQRRWQSLGEPGCFASPKFEQFLREAANALFEKDLLCLSWLTLKGEPVAVDFSLQCGSGLYGYQSGISPDHLAMNPGRVLLMASIKQAIRDGFAFMDFLRGDEEYKRHWRAETCPVDDIVIKSNRPIAFLRHQLVDVTRALLTSVRA